MSRLITFKGDKLRFARRSKKREISFELFYLLFHHPKAIEKENFIIEKYLINFKLVDSAEF